MEPKAIEAIRELLDYLWIDEQRHWYECGKPRITYSARLDCSTAFWIKPSAGKHQKSGGGIRITFKNRPCGGGDLNPHGVTH